MRETLPTDSAERKDVPLARGVLDYFPAALAAVARLSKVGNDKHNPGEDMHHARGKSTDHADCILRHLAERGTYDTDGMLHDVKVAWRALALLQETLEAIEGAPLPRGAWEETPLAVIAPEGFDVDAFVRGQDDLGPFAGMDLENDPVPSGNFFEEDPFPIGSLVDEKPMGVTQFRHGEVISYDFDGHVEVQWWGLDYTKMHDPSELEVREGEDFREDRIISEDDWVTWGERLVEPETGRMVPEVHSIGPELGSVDNPTTPEQLRGEPAPRFAPNDIQERIAGQTEASRDIKNEYYGVKVEKTVFKPGDKIRDATDNWEGEFISHTGNLANVAWTFIAGHHPSEPIRGRCNLRDLVPA